MSVVPGMAPFPGTMPADLAALFSELQNEVISLASEWEDYKHLYGSQEHIDFLNASASAFFSDLQRVQQFSIMLQLSCLTDPPKSAGKDTLTIKRFPSLINDATLLGAVEGLIQAADVATGFAREWRNRRLAHTELPAALKGAPAVPLPRAAWHDIEYAIESISAVMDAVQLHYCGSTTLHGAATALSGGVGSLIYFLEIGLEADRERRKKLGA